MQSDIQNKIIFIQTDLFTNIKDQEHIKNEGRLASIGKPPFTIAFSYQKQPIVKSKIAAAVK